MRPPPLGSGVDVATATGLLANVIESPGENETQAVLRNVRLLEPSGILQGLYSVDFLGVQEITTGAFTFCHDVRRPDVAFEDRSRLLISQMRIRRASTSSPII
jgi:hypothetical protein